MQVHSMVDTITNSSTEIYTSLMLGSKSTIEKMIQDIIDNILPGHKASEYFDVVEWRKVRDLFKRTSTRVSVDNLIVVEQEHYYDDDNYTYKIKPSYIPDEEYIEAIAAGYIDGSCSKEDYIEKRYEVEGRSFGISVMTKSGEEIYDAIKLLFSTIDQTAYYNG